MKADNERHSLSKSRSQESKKNKKKRVSLEDLSPYVEQKPIKKKRQNEEIVKNFNKVYHDICDTPDNGTVKKSKTPKRKSVVWW